MSGVWYIFFRHINFVIIIKGRARKIYKVFWQHIRHYRMFFVFLLIITTGTELISVIIPLYYKQFFDLIFSGATPAVVAPLLTRLIFIIFFFHLTAWVMWRIRSFTDTHFRLRVTIDIVNTCFAYLHHHSYRFFANQFVGSLVRRVNRLADSFEGIWERFIDEVLPLVVRLSAILVVLAYRRPMLALILLAWSAAYLIANYLFVRFKVKYDVAAAAIDSEVTGRLADTITNNINIKVFTGFRKEFAAFKELTLRQFRAWRFAINLNEVIVAFQILLMIAVELMIFIYAIRYWEAGILTVGDFALIQAYLLQVFDKLWNFGNVVRRIYKYLADGEEMVDILNTPHDVTDKPTATPLIVTTGAIEFRNVDFAYNPTRLVLKHFNLLVATGERVGLVGSSGAGKSTIAALMLRFFEVTDGAILIDGKNIADATQESLRATISYVSQEPILFHRTLMENIHYGRPDATDAEVFDAAQRAHCNDFIENLPQKYQTFVGERGIKLSGGERQRIAIARAILKDAPILILDEATSSLDSKAETTIQAALGNLMKGKTVIVIAHRLSTIMKMDRIVVLREGEIAEQGTHTELLANLQGLYRSLWELQVGGFIGDQKK